MQLSETRVKEIYDKVLQKYERLNIPERFDHILGVVEMSTLLAKRNNIDVLRMQVAALLHDYYKYESLDAMKNYLNDSQLIAECSSYPFLYHAYCSCKAALEEFQIEDEEILRAIKYHVFGHLNMSRFEEIILISDYTEKNRTYESCVACRKLVLAGKLNEAIYLSTKDTIDFVIKEGHRPHEIQEMILNIYKEKANI